MREEYPNPYYWLGFVLSSDPGFGLGARGQEKSVNSSNSPVAVEVDEGQSSGNCLSLLVIIGTLGAVGVVVRRRNS